jgi:CHASE1-domain containing sensor protein
MAITSRVCASNRCLHKLLQNRHDPQPANLQKLTLVGNGGCRNQAPGLSYFSDVFARNDTREQLRAVSHLGRRVKDAFRKQGRAMIVNIRLLYGQAVGEETMN